MNILITGGAGYVGSTICSQLWWADDRVVILDNMHKGNADSLIPFASNENFNFVKGSILDKPLLEKIKAEYEIDSVIHLAAIVGFPQCAANPELARLVNVEGTRNIAEVFHDCHVVFASTGSVYGKVTDELCTEETACRTNTVYGLTKLEAEKIIWELKSSIIFRFATGFGVSPNMRVNLLVNDLAFQAVHNRCICVFESQAKRTFIHVVDMANLLLDAVKLLHHNPSAQKYIMYNAGSHNGNASKRDIAEMLKEKTGCAVSYMDFAKDLDERDYEVCYEKINELFPGFDESCISIEAGVDELIKTVPLMKINHQYM